ncbi:AbrB/MazE/SpoVT family DNA-binding domain-containing protein [Candidatus Gottesmanbacteria bacterium]|nr:AbrB/MazE/SpoVT family DNA-binding domain-containing protein [Candidatus Gottesmanbacteria bacterium]
MDTRVRFVKSFSKGQITIPKEFREKVGMEDEFWLKLYLQDGKIIAEPAEKQKTKEDYKKKLLKLKSINFDTKQLKRNRDQIEKQITKRAV